jgi:hypothetical protein
MAGRFGMIKRRRAAAMPQSGTLRGPGSMSIQKLFCTALGVTLLWYFAVVATTLYGSAVRLIPFGSVPVKLPALPRSTEQPAPA